MSENFYTEITFSKSGKQIPLKDKISFHSKYSPEKEAENFANEFDSEGFFVIIGLCGGYHIEKLHEKFPSSKIVAVENSDEDISFLSQIECVKNLKKEKNIFIANSENLEKTILENYLPALDGNLFIKPLRAYENAFPDSTEKEIKIIKNALKLVSADFSVQKHFGKIWQHNIIENLSLAEKCADFSDFTKEFDTSKTAAIIAAGPSLNKTVLELKANRKKYFVISTDTAFGALKKNGITADVVVSVDGQMVSHSHFMFKPEKKTKFVFDLCASPSAIKKLLKNGNEILFCESNHPLASFANHYDGKNHFVHLETGSGTVTIAAVNFAICSEFKKIKLYGADFSYIDGLPYAKGTYLDSNFRQNETRLSNAETKFANLLYRTEIIKISKNRFTTEILNSYKKTLEDFFKKNEIKKISENEYLAKNENKNQNFETEKFNFIDFREKFISELKKIRISESEINTSSPIFMTLLPFCASLGEKSSFLAYSKTLSYTERI